MPAAFIHSLIGQSCKEHLLYDSLYQYSNGALSGIAAFWASVATVYTCEVFQMELQRHAFDVSRSDFLPPYLGCKVFSYLHLTFLGLLSFKLVVHVMDEK